MAACKGWVRKPVRSVHRCHSHGSSLLTSNWSRPSAFQHSFPRWLDGPAMNRGSQITWAQGARRFFARCSAETKRSFELLCKETKGAQENASKGQALRWQKWATRPCT